MKFSITHNHSELYPDHCIVTGVFEGSQLFPSTNQINKISQGYIAGLLKRNPFNGLIGQHLLLYDAPYFLNKQILLMGCGKKTEFNQKKYTEIIYQLIEFCQNSSITKILLLLSEVEISSYNNYWKIRHSITLFNSKLYTFNKFKSHTTKKSNNKSLNEIIMYISSSDDLQICQKAVTDGLAIARGINSAKDLGNMPPNYCNPNYLTNKVQKLTKLFHNLDIEILDETQITKLGMNAYLSVGRGSNYPAVMPIIKYQKHPNTLNTNPIILIGKGLTFDSGGISIKSSNNMDEMKYDMCGAAVVYAVMCIASELNLPLNIIGILAISENMISSTSLRPGDILTTLSGQTVEVLNTDAEGRLVLCDVLTYASKKYNPEIIIDIATLTGACAIALGNYFTGFMSNDENLATDLIQSSKQTRDHIWRLPLHEDFNKQLQSNYADMTNIGSKFGSIITSACFLRKFIYNNSKWAHLDIAGTAWDSNNFNKSSTGRPVELLSQFLLNKKTSIHSNE